MAKFVCTVCGYIYDEEVGDPDNGIEPGTLFADLTEEGLIVTAETKNGTGYRTAKPDELKKGA